MAHRVRAGINMNTRDLELVEVPPPLFKYEGEQVVHDDNQSIIDLQEDPAILPKKTVKAIQHELQTIAMYIEAENIDEWLVRADLARADIKSIKQRGQGLKEILHALCAIYEDLADNEDDVLATFLCGALILRTVRKTLELKNNLRDAQEHHRKIMRALDPARPTLVRQKKLRQKIASHRAALDDQQKEEFLRQQMDQEVQIVCSTIVQVLARCGHSFRYTKGKKTVTDYVQIDYAVATPDTIQVKIMASKVGLFGGSVDLLPQGVYVTDIISDKIMKELSVALEREVWSPHLSNDRVTLANGAWIVVERLGLYEGIPRNVTYKQLMARYETADHEKIPIPSGLKRGRRINWVHLDTPQGLHLMFNGISGSGKSNAMRAMASAIIEKQDPAEIRFIFIDLKKQGDFREFADSPHCIRHEDKGVLTEIDEVVCVLQNVADEMHMRQERIGLVAKNLIDYNKRVDPTQKMPRLIVVFDEYANTRRSRFSEQANIIDDICIEIGQVGRASGISLWIGIQQPRSDNMPPPLRDNITTVFMGHQANVGAAQSVSGSRETLRLEHVPGRMQATIGAITEKVQMPFIPDEDVVNAVNIAKQNYGDAPLYKIANFDNPDYEKPPTLIDMLLDVAFLNFDGDLKASKLYDLLRDEMSRSEVRNTVDEITSRASITYKGMRYRPERQSGNYYRLIPDSELAG